jgi:hypothetical protein
MSAKLVARVINDVGRAFNVVLVRKGDAYGRNDCLTHDAEDPLVEFYDATYEADDRFYLGRGQFVSRYYLRTLTDRKVRRGLDLCGHEPAWKISSQNVADALVAVDAELRGTPKEVVAREDAERKMFGCTAEAIDEALDGLSPRDVAMYAMGTLSNAQELIQRGDDGWTVADRDTDTIRRLINVAKYALDKAVPR